MKIRKFLFDFFVIFLSVMLAFFAEDYREDRQDMNDYTLILEQISSDLKSDSAEFANDYRFIKEEIDAINSLLNVTTKSPIDSIRDNINKVLHVRWGDTNNTGINQLRNHSSYVGDKQEINSLISRTYSWFVVMNEYNKYNYVPDVKSFRSYLLSINFPLSNTFTREQFLTNNLSREQEARLLEIVSSDDFKSQLEFFKNSKIALRIRLAISINRANHLSRYLDDPTYRFDTNQLGIAGTSTEGGEFWYHIMQEVEPNIWEIELELIDGDIGMRFGPEWEGSYGGDNFPTGKAIPRGPRIKVKQGKYKIRFDANNLRYEFIKLP